MKKLNPKLQKELIKRKNELQKSLDEKTYKIDSLELIRLINNPHPLASEFAKKEKKDV